MREREREISDYLPQLPLVLDTPHLSPEWLASVGVTSYHQGAVAQTPVPFPGVQGTVPVAPGQSGMPDRRPWRWLEPACVPSHDSYTETRSS